MTLSRSTVSVGSSLLRRIGAPLAVAAVAAALVAPSVASAGTLQVRDDAMLLSPSDRASLQSSVATYPFDVRVLTTNAFSDRLSFDRYVGAQVASPNMVVIAIAPAIRRTSVHFGTGTRIGPQHWRAIEDAGDPFFRSGQWGMGVSAIAGRAATFVGTGPANMPSQSQPQFNYRGAPPVGYRVSTTRERSGFPIGTVLCVGLGVAMIVGLVALARRATRAASGGFDGGYRTPGQPGPFGGPSAPGYGPGYGPTYGAPTGGISPMTAGIAGAAVGGLAGYAIGRAMDDHGHTETYTTTTYDSPPSYGSGDSYGGSSYDAGGSSSGWDSGGGDSGGGGFDGGGDW
jgi:uncharacterized membrane protein YgcG